MSTAPSKLRSPGITSGDIAGLSEGEGEGLASGDVLGEGDGLGETLGSIKEVTVLVRDQ